MTSRRLFVISHRVQRQLTNGHLFLCPRRYWNTPWFRHREHRWSLLTSPDAFNLFVRILISCVFCTTGSSESPHRTKFSFSPPIFSSPTCSFRFTSYLCIAISFAIKLCRSFVTRHLPHWHFLNSQFFLWPFKMLFTSWLRHLEQTCRLRTRPMLKFVSQLRAALWQ